MKKRASLDEIVAKRRLSARDDGAMFKSVVLDGEETKKYDAATRSQRFTMSSESTDRYGDIVRQDGMVLDNFLKNPVALAFHNHRAPIGWWSDIRKIGGGKKRTEGLLSLHAEGTTDAIDEVGRLLGAAAIKACSIGFMPLEAEWILDEEGRNTYGLDFISSELLECSVCSIPANPEALAKAAGGDMRMAAEMFEQFLDTYCERTTGGLLVRKEFEEAYASIKAADKIKDKNADKTIKVKLELDSSEVAEELDGIFARFQKKFTDLFASAPEPKAEPVADERRSLVIHKFVDENRKETLKVDEWLPKTIMDEEMVDDPLTKHLSFVSLDDDTVRFKDRESEAEYKVVSKDEYGRLLLDLVEVKKIEPEPVLVPNSRAKAKAKTADLMARLRLQGVIT